jgi:hypothetical protein
VSLTPPPWRAAPEGLVWRRTAPSAAAVSDGPSGLVDTPVPRAPGAVGAEGRGDAPWRGAAPRRPAPTSHRCRGRPWRHGPLLGLQAGVGAPVHVRGVAQGGQPRAGPSPWAPHAAEAQQRCRVLHAADLPSWRPPLTCRPAPWARLARTPWPVVTPAPTRAAPAPWPSRALGAPVGRRHHPSAAEVGAPRLPWRGFTSHGPPRDGATASRFLPAHGSAAVVRRCFRRVVTCTPGAWACGRLACTLAAGSNATCRTAPAGRRAVLPADAGTSAAPIGPISSPRAGTSDRGPTCRTGCRR